MAGLAAVGGFYTDARRARLPTLSVPRSVSVLLRAKVNFASTWFALTEGVVVSVLGVLVALARSCLSRSSVTLTCGGRGAVACADPAARAGASRIIIVCAARLQPTK
ncbi:hypothetical protein GUJ93_ZPchr0001g32802 [Zizania palustris]|uniref:Uncharacterized protein n=1 Tax=Zizania palustris TaxID=103762 RepID=A0A8J5SG40_ZIZPA|nr:hypothetical protein GUJ93_ZPchr0001g32802 [Zizania palustris]